MDDKVELVLAGTGTERRIRVVDRHVPRRYTVSAHGAVGRLRILVSHVEPLSLPNLRGVHRAASATSRDEQLSSLHLLCVELSRFAFSSPRILAGSLWFCALPPARR